MRKFRSFIFVLFVSVPPLIQVSVADASIAGAACKKAGSTKGTTSNKLICKKVGKNLKWVSLSSTTTTTSTTMTAALTCAIGGKCIVGDTGPGGGIVFYVAATNFTSTGSDCGTTCQYLEASRDDSPQWSWCSDLHNVLGTTGTAIGTGMANTATADKTCTSGAIQIAADYTNNGKTDWHLPSKDELNQMCKWQRGQAWVSDATICNGTGSLNSVIGASGSAKNYYWSSTENDYLAAWYQGFGDVIQAFTFKSFRYNVRSVRAF